MLCIDSSPTNSTFFNQLKSAYTYIVFRYLLKWTFESVDGDNLSYNMQKYNFFLII